jgi:hypothetical protein
MPNVDFIPRSDHLFDPWQNNFVNKVNLHKSGWGLPANAITEWTLLTDTNNVKKKAWDVAWKKVSSGMFYRSDTQRKNDARRSYESGNINDPEDVSLRFFINRFIRNNPRVTNDQKVDMGLRVPDLIKTPSPGASGSGVNSEVFGTIIIVRHLIHTSRVITPGSTKKGLEKGVEAIEVYLSITEAGIKVAPAIREFNLVGEVKRGLYTHTFDFEQEEMRAWYIARKRYKGRIRTYGPFSEPWSGLIW